MTRTELTPAVLIHRRTYKKNSLLLDFFAKDYGKIRLIAKGIRSSKNNIQMFQILNISFSGKSSLQSLSNFEVNDIPRIITGSKLILCIYVNELMSRLLADNDPHPALFNIYFNLISKINELEKKQLSYSLRIFEDDLLTEIGYGLDYTQDTQGRPIDADKNYVYQEQNGFTATDKGAIPGILLNLLNIKDILKIPNEQQLKIWRNLNRVRINQLLGDKPLKSRSLFYATKK